MPLLRPSLSGLIDQAIADITTAQLPTLTGQLLPKAVLRVLGTSIAGMASLHYAYLDWISKQSVPYTASDEYLAAWAALKGVLREPETAAQGSAQFTGITGSIVPGGTVLGRQDGQTYTLTTDLTIDPTGQAVGQVLGQPGALSNCDAGTVLGLNTSISGVDATATTTTALVGGADQELDDSLKNRMLQAYASPPMGGTAEDYVRWALEVPGVTRAWCNGMGGVGGVVVYTMFDITNADNNGFPIGTDGVSHWEGRYTVATGQQLLVADHIYPLRPVTALVFAAAPLPTPINITIANLIPSSASIQASIQQAIADKFVSIGSPLGMTLYQSDITTAIESVPGVQEFVLISPATTVTLSVGQLPVVGNVTYQ